MNFFLCVRLNDLRITSYVNKLLSLQAMMCVQTAWKTVQVTPNTATTTLMG